MIQIAIPTDRAEVDEVRDLMRAFVAWHRERHLDDLDLIDRYFDSGAFDAELASLPGEYSPPDGVLLLATYDHRPAGCAALRRIDNDSCEMKRMFVHPAFQGKGIGRALAEAIIAHGRALGYRSMMLDTSIRQPEAQSLYRRFGFRELSRITSWPRTCASGCCSWSCHFSRPFSRRNSRVGGQPRRPARPIARQTSRTLVERDQVALEIQQADAIRPCCGPAERAWHRPAHVRESE